MKVTLAAALFLGATLGLTTAAMAQPYYGRAYGGSVYDYAPGPGPGAYYGYDNYGPAASDCDRGGPGPRSGCGSGMGIGAER